MPHLDLVPETELAATAPDGVSIHGARLPLGMIGPDGRIITKVGPAVIRAFADLCGRIDDESASEGNFGLGYRTKINGGWILDANRFFEWWSRRMTARSIRVCSASRQ